MKKLLIASSIIGACVLLNGCATMFGDSNRTLSVNSQPSGAQVLLNGQSVGVTPTQVQLAEVKGNYIQVQKPGYQPTNTPVNTVFQNVGWWNILFWPGFIVDAATGNMMKIQNPVINVTLAPVEMTTTMQQSAPSTSTAGGVMVQTTTVATPIAGTSNTAVAPVANAPAVSMTAAPAAGTAATGNAMSSSAASNAVAAKSGATN